MKETFLVGLCILLGAIMLGASVFWRPSLFSSEDGYLADKEEWTAHTPTTTSQECPVEVVKKIHDIITISDAILLGEAYFGGIDEYNLSCARRAYLRAVELDPQGSLVVWHQLGRIDFLEGNFEGATAKFDTQIAYFGNTLPNVHYMLGLTYGYKARRDQIASDWEKAEESFKKYIALDPASPWARVDLAWILFSQGKYQEMKPLLEEALIVHPKNPWLLNMYGLALLNTADKEGAYLYFKAAHTETKKVTVDDWGAAYPGNDPKTWERGLAEMVSAIEKNYELVRGEFET